MNTLNLLYAQLELRFDLLRAVTPKYSNYSYKPSANFEAATKSDTTPLAKGVKSVSTGKTTKTVDIDRVVAMTGAKREDVVRKLQNWNDSGIITLKPSGVVNRYRMLKPSPTDPREMEKMIDMAYEQMEGREVDDLRRSKQVIGLITSAGCFAVALAAHFGDAVDRGKCGKCQFCETGIKVEMGKTEKSVRVPIDEDKFRAVLKACASRDDPRLLARIAFGISSPRVMTEKCGAKNPVFGSMVNCDFDVSIFTPSLPVCWWRDKSTDLWWIGAGEEVCGSLQGGWCGVGGGFLLDYRFRAMWVSERLVGVCIGRSKLLQ